MAKKKKKRSYVFRNKNLTSDNGQKAPRQIITYTPEQLLELKRCSEDIFYFIQNYMYIVEEPHGNVLFKPYDYQKEIIKTFMGHKNSIALASRQLGKSTCSVAFLLWSAMFKSEQTILVVSNVFTAASEIMERVRYSYELIPDWLKPGVDVYNKTSITFDNKSRIIARATTKNSARGLSLSILYCDELSSVDYNKQRDFWAAIRPTLSTGGKCIITSTPGSDEDVFAQIWLGAINTFDEYGNEIPNGVGRNGFKSIRYIWSDHPKRDAQWEKEERAAMGDDERFAREHECRFIGNDETLINPMALSRLKGRDPIRLTGRVRWYSDPIPNRTYLMSLDPSMGTGKDFAAIQVFQLPEMIQVAEWQHNKTEIPAQIKILRDIGKYIEECQKQGGTNTGEIYWTVENSLLGEAANIVIKEIGEENFAGQYLSQSHKHGAKRKIKGFWMTNKLKLETCARLKTLVERDKIHINSKALVTELKTFVSKGASYAAKGSEHDDLVMALILIVKMLERMMSFDDLIRNTFQETVEDSVSGSRMPLWGVFI